MSKVSMGTGAPPAKIGRFPQDQTFSLPAKPERLLAALVHAFRRATYKLEEELRPTYRGLRGLADPEVQARIAYWYGVQEALETALFVCCDPCPPDEEASTQEFVLNRDEFFGSIDQAFGDLFLDYDSK